MTVGKKKLENWQIILGVVGLMGLAWSVQGSIDGSQNSEIEQTQTNLKDYRELNNDCYHDLIDRMARQEERTEYIIEKVDDIYKEIKER